MSPFPKWLVLGGSGLTGATGVVYWWMAHMMEPASDFAVINHPLQPWVLKAHILVAPLLVFALGLITTDHIWKHFRASLKVRRRSGVTTLWTLVPMVLSGYLIQAVTHSGWLAAMVWVHIGTGLVYLVGLGIHQVLRQRLVDT